MGEKWNPTFDLSYTQTWQRKRAWMQTPLKSFSLPSGVVGKVGKGYFKFSSALNWAFPTFRQVKAPLNRKWVLMERETIVRYFFPKLPTYDFCKIRATFINCSIFSISKQFNTSIKGYLSSLVTVSRLLVIPWSAQYTSNSWWLLLAEIIVG